MCPLSLNPLQPCLNLWTVEVSVGRGLVETFDFHLSIWLAVSILEIDDT